MTEGEAEEWMAERGLEQVVVDIGRERERREARLIAAILAPSEFFADAEDVQNYFMLMPPEDDEC